MHEQESSAAISGLSLAAGLFALLFLVSGADGQELVQLSFLLLSAGCLLLEQWGESARHKLQAWLLHWQVLRS